MFKELRNFGLSDKESKVYVATLELGKATAQDIAKKANVNRATTYVQLESLKEQGLVTQISQAKRTFFMAEPPENVKKLIEKEKVEILFKENEFSKILPNLQAIYNVKEGQPKVRFYEGDEGVVLHRNDFLKSEPREINVILPYKDEAFHPDFEIVRKFFGQAKKANLIYISPKRDNKFEEFVRKAKFLNVKWIGKEKCNIITEIVISEKQLWINKMGGIKIGVMVEDREIAENFTSIFNLLWQIAK